MSSRNCSNNRKINYILLLLMKYIVISSAVTEDSCQNCGVVSKHTKSKVSKVYNGTRVNPAHKYPWVVGVIVDSDPFCMGAIISSKFILTANHCVNDHSSGKSCNETDGKPRPCVLDANRIQVLSFLGDDKETISFNDSTKYNVSNVISHEGFDLEGRKHDIALLELADEIVCGQDINPLCIPPQDEPLDASNLDIVVVGNGLNSSEPDQIYREGIVNQIDVKECTNVSKEDPNDIREEEELFCVSGRKTYQNGCQGDSGSVLFAKFNESYYGLGVVSTTDFFACIYGAITTTTSLNFYRDWIEDKVGSLPKPVEVP